MTRAPARDEHRAVQQALKAALRARVGLFEGRYCSPEMRPSGAEHFPLTGARATNSQRPSKVIQPYPDTSNFPAQKRQRLRIVLLRTPPRSPEFGRRIWWAQKISSKISRMKSGWRQKGTRETRPDPAIWGGICRQSLSRDIAVPFSWILIRPGDVDDGQKTESAGDSPEAGSDLQNLILSLTYEDGLPMGKGGAVLARLR